MVGGPKNWKGSPNTRVTKEDAQFTKNKEIKNLQKSALTWKLVNPFTRAQAPPFIGRRRDFYIPKIPSNIGNIPNVNMYTNVFYISWFTGLISYIYKLATSSHLKPTLLRWRLWLCSFLIPESLFHEDHHFPRLPNQIFINSPNFADSCFQNFAGFRFQIFAGSRPSQVPDSITSQVSTILK
jgi:hypothetical protein